MATTDVVEQQRHRKIPLKRHAEQDLWEINGDGADPLKQCTRVLLAASQAVVVVG